MSDFPKTEIPSFGAMCRHFIEKGIITVKQIAQGRMVSETTAYTNVNDDQGDSWLAGINNCLRVWPEAFADAFIKAICFRTRYRVVKADPIKSTADVVTHMVNAVKEASEALCKAHEAQADGIVSNDEKASVSSEIQQAIVALEDAYACLNGGRRAC